MTKLGSASRYGSRYGTPLKQTVSKIEEVQKGLYKDDYLSESYCKRCSELQRLESRLGRLLEVLHGTEARI